MIIIIIGAAILGLAVYLFTKYWEEILGFIDAVVGLIVDGVKAVVTFFKRAGRAFTKVYTRLVNGKVRIDIEPEKHGGCHRDDLPSEIESALFENDQEVIVRNIQL